MINTDTNQVIATVAVQTSPTAIAVSPDGKSVWVANSGSRTVQRIDTQSNTVVATVMVGTTPTALAVNGDSVWVANTGQRQCLAYQYGHQHGGGDHRRWGRRPARWRSVGTRCMSPTRTVIRFR